MGPEIDSFPEYMIGRAIYLYLSPIILFVGIVGNLLSFKVLWKRAKQPPPTYLYLSVLALVDIFALLLPTIQGWLKYLIEFDLTTFLACSWFYILFFTPSNISTNIVVNVTIDRFICVFFPLAASSVCTHKRALLGMAGISVFHLALHLHYPWTLVVGEITTGNLTTTTCVAPAGFEQWSYHIWPIIDLSAYSFIPFVLLVIFNSLIIYKMAQQQKVMSGAASNRFTDQRRTTLVLVLVSLCQLLTTTPIVVLHIIEPYWDHKEPQQMALHMMVTSICQHVSYLNNCVNFFLYGLSGKKFRDDLLEELRCGRKTKGTSAFHTEDTKSSTRTLHTYSGSQTALANNHQETKSNEIAATNYFA